MASDLEKRLERARRYLEKNRLDDAIKDYEAALELEPSNAEALQALADIHTRLSNPQRAARYYGELFDQYFQAGDANRAAVLYAKFLRPVPQPAERVARYGLLLQRQNRREDAIQHYAEAAQLYLAERNHGEALASRERIAQLDPDNPGRQLDVADLAEKLGRADVAARACFRAAQLNLAGGELNAALELFDRAHRLAGEDRTIALYYAEAQLQRGDPARAVELLAPFSASENDPAFLKTFGEALMRVGQLDRAREVFEQLYAQKPDAFEKLFELADLHARSGDDPRAVEILAALRARMGATRQETDFAMQLERVAAANPRAMVLTEFCAQFYSETNRESKYFTALERLFELSLARDNVTRACEVLDRLLDIDPYDHGHQQRMKALEGKADAVRLRGLRARLAQAATGGAGLSVARPGQKPTAEAGDQELEDLIVQAEIFLQYSLLPKVQERLQRIAVQFLAEFEHNERLRRLCEMSGWWPPGIQRGPVAASPARPGRELAEASPETNRDLARIAEITRVVYRQATPKAVLSAAVNEIGKYLRAARCLAVIGAPGQPPQLAAEFCSPGVEPSSGGQIVKLLTLLDQVAPDPIGGLTLQSGETPVLAEMGLETVLAVPLTDKETQTPAGMLVAGHAAPYAWRPNETYFLQAVGDQVLISVNHTRLRTLVRTLAVADEKTGLLSRGSYQDCLLAESNRTKSQDTPLALVILQLDRGPELIREHGEAVVERYLEQVARTLQPVVRQNDLAIRYTAVALAFLLPDTALSQAAGIADKLRRASAGVPTVWNSGAVSFSGVAAEAVRRPDFDSEDIVTELINRVESGLEEARKRGGDTVVVLENPRI